MNEVKRIAALISNPNTVGLQVLLPLNLYKNYASMGLKMSLYNSTSMILNANKDVQKIKVVQKLNIGEHWYSAKLFNYIFYFIHVQGANNLGPLVIYKICRLFATETPQFFTGHPL